MDPDRPAVDQDLAGIGAVKAVDDVHQRRLPRAVFTDQAVDAALRHRERNRAVRVHRAETLVNAAQLQRRRDNFQFFSHEWAREDTNAGQPANLSCGPFPSSEARNRSRSSFSFSFSAESIERTRMSKRARTIDPTGHFIRQPTAPGTP